MNLYSSNRAWIDLHPDRAKVARAQPSVLLDRDFTQLNHSRRDGCAQVRSYVGTLSRRTARRSVRRPHSGAGFQIDAVAQVFIAEVNGIGIGGLVVRHTIQEIKEIGGVFAVDVIVAIV